MKVIEVEAKIGQDILMQAKVEETEEMVNEVIRDALSAKIVSALDDMAYVDMEFNDSDNSFDIKASLVLCSTTDMSTSIAMMAKVMHDKGLSEDDIGEILEPLMESKEGF